MPDVDPDLFTIVTAGASIAAGQRVEVDALDSAIPFVVEPDPTFVVEPLPVVEPDVEVLDGEPVPPAKPIGGAIQLFDRTSGEIAVPLTTAAGLLSAYGIPDVTEATMETLAAFEIHAIEARGIIGEAQGMASTQRVALLDREGSWTQHVADSVTGARYKVVAPSPTAGTTAYDTDLLLAAVNDGVKRGVISQDAADNALEPVHGTPDVTFDLLRRVRAGLASELTAAAEELVLRELDAVIDRAPDPTYRQRPSGINALLKIPAMKAAIEACRVEVAPPVRKAKVTQVKREA